MTHRHPILLFALPLLFLTTLPERAAGWGGGHVDWQRRLHEILPAEFMDRVDPETADLAIREWSKYIDSFDGFEPDAELIGPSGLARLESSGIARRYDLHSERARAVNFLLLVEALQEERFDAALFWIACLGHSAADMSAGNHDPLLHLATYDWATLEFPEPRPPSLPPVQDAVRMLDLSHTASHPEGIAAFVEASERLRIPDDGRDLSTALLEIMRYGQEGAAFCVSRGPAIWSAALARAEEDNETTRKALFEPVTELGAWALVRVARGVEVALRFAAGPSVPGELEPSLLEVHAEEIIGHIEGRKLEDELLYADILRPLSAGSPEHPGRIGVVLEPTWRMNEGMLGFSDRTTAAMICRSLDLLGHERASLDLRDLVREGVPAPARLPYLVLPARQLNSYHHLRRDALVGHLLAYREAGGKILWIGGNTAPSAAPVLAESLTSAEEGHWPVAADAMEDSLVGLVGREAQWRIQRNPHTPAGWHRPYGKWFLDTEGGGLAKAIEPLLSLQSGPVTFWVGALECPPGLAPLAWVPVYALHPWLITPATEIDNLTAPRLDEAGEEILLGALAALGLERE